MLFIPLPLSMVRTLIEFSVSWNKGHMSVEITSVQSNARVENGSHRQKRVNKPSSSIQLSGDYNVKKIKSNKIDGGQRGLVKEREIATEITWLTFPFFFNF
jgi:hypothetical protein